MKTYLHLFCLLFAFGSLYQRSQAQSPHLLKSLEQRYNFQNQLWIDGNKKSFAYDQMGNETQQLTYNQSPCLVDDPEDYCDFTESFSHNIRSRQYNDLGFETSLAEMSYFYSWQSNNTYQIRNDRTYKRSTEYKDDSLILNRYTSEEYNYGHNESEWSKTRIQRKYDNENRIIFEEHIQQNQHNGADINSHISRHTYFYSKGNLVGQIEIVRNAVGSDTTYYSNDVVESIYNKNGLVIETTQSYTSSYLGEEPYTYRTKESYYYNDKEQLVQSELLQWNQQEEVWFLESTTDFAYHPNGQIYQQNIIRPQDKAIRVSSTRYNESGKIVFQKNEYQDSEGNVIQSEGWSTYAWYEGAREGMLWTAYDADGQIEFAYKYYTEYNQKGNPTSENSYWWEYDENPENTFKFVSEKSNEYDKSGFLVESKQNRYVLNSDSILSEERYDLHSGSITSYENRCDGVPLVITSEQWTYIPGTDFEKYPDTYKTRQLNEYSPSICGGSNTKMSEIVVYPNPSSGLININSDLLATPGTKMELMDLNGKLLLTEMAQIAYAFQMDISTIAPGVYIIKLTNEAGEAEKKIVRY